MSKIEWSNVNGSIALRANQTKTNRKREIKVVPNLRAWLDRYAALGGDCTGKVVKLTEDQLAEKRRANWKAAGFEKIPQDIAQHSFCSYLLARDGDLTAALLASGHSSPKIFWAHYYQHSSAENTARFWGIIPPAPNKEIAAKIGVTPRCIRDWRNRRIIPFLQIGMIVRFHQSDVAQALKQYKREAEVKQYA